MKRSIVTCLLAAFLLTACGNEQPEQPAVDPVVERVPTNWDLYQKNRVAEKAAYINENQAAYDWFANFSFSEVDGVPYIILKLMPEIAPEIWGDKGNFLSVIGLFYDERQPTYPLPRGIGFSGLSRSDPSGNIDYTSFTCGACHIGRVRLDSGNYQYLDGAVNTQFNIVLYRVKAYGTLQKIYGIETDKTKRVTLVEAAILTALDKVHQRDKNFFYKNYSYSGRKFDAAYENQQINLFKDNVRAIIEAYIEKSENDYTGYVAVVDKNYKGFENEMLHGFGGMADATGISTANGYVAFKKYPIIGHFASSLVLPPTPGLTDFMTVWEQNKRKAHWNRDNTQLVDGGGQWNGSIPIPMYRNLVAQSTLGLKNIDLRVSAFSVGLLDRLPASTYPFDVDVDLAKKGERLFEDNCAGCHQPHNGKVYNNLGVNLDRARVVNTLIASAARKSLTALCSPSTTVDLGHQKVKPCAEFSGVSLTNKKYIAMSPPKQHRGYNATPLSGIWAQAPYLHNGSVPTLYHLLVSRERPSQFMRGRLGYDKKLVGFSWDLLAASSIENESEYLFDTQAFPAVSNAGHDGVVYDGFNIYKLDWSDDKQGALAIVEYLKTL